jgi:hypothetical protein
VLWPYIPCYIVDRELHYIYTKVCGQPFKLVHSAISATPVAVSVMNSRGDWFQAQGPVGVYCKGPQEEAGSWVQGQAEGHTQGVQKATVQAGKRLVT